MFLSSQAKRKKPPKRWWLPPKWTNWWPMVRRLQSGKMGTPPTSLRALYFSSCVLLGVSFSVRRFRFRTAPLARAAAYPETEPLTLRLEGEEETRGGPCRPYGERPPHGVAAAGGVAPDAAFVPFPSGRRMESCGSRRRRIERIEVRVVMANRRRSSEVPDGVAGGLESGVRGESEAYCGWKASI